jgi:hypothetical protein
MHAIHFLLVVATTFSYLFEKLSSNHTVKMHILAYSICATQMPELSKMSRMIKLEQPVVQRMMALSRENQRTLQDEWNDATGQAGTKLMCLIKEYGVASYNSYEIDLTMSGIAEASSKRRIELIVTGMESMIHQQK